MTDDISIPSFLDRIHGRSMAEIDAERLRLIKKHGSTKLKMGRLKNPSRSAKSTGLGMSLKELRASVQAKKGA
jgi:hypothetical protein